MQPIKTYERGFTLLELLVALTICVFIGIGAYAMLQSTLKTSQTTKEHSRYLNQLQKALWIIEQDFHQAKPKTLIMPSGNYALNFIRIGWPNPQDLPRDNVMNIAYEFSNNQLKRHYWPPNDINNQQTQILLEDISNFTIRPVNTLSVEILFHSLHYGDMRRIIEIPVL